MSADKGITVEEWLKELSKLGAKNAEGFTTEEAAEKYGRSVHRTRLQMKKAFTAGLLELAGFRGVIRMDGRPTQVPVYRVVRKGKAR